MQRFLFVWIIFLAVSISPAFAQDTVKKAGKSYAIINEGEPEFFASPYGRNIIQASYPGGKHAFIKFLGTHMQLPDSLMVADTSDFRPFKMVFANFEIQKDGTVSDAVLAGRFDPKIDADLKRVIKLSAWTPFISDGKPVPGGYSMRIYFIKK